MYKTSDNYKKLVYADKTKHVLNIYIEGNKVNSDHILDFKMSHNLFSNDEFILGNVTAKTIEFKIYKDSLPTIYNNFYVETGIDSEIIPIGYFLLEEIQKDDDGKIITIKAIDYMIKFEFNYDGSKLNYPCTIETVLKDICLNAKVDYGSSSFLKMDQEIAVYDNTVSARDYLSYIAEQAGGFAYIGRDGKLYIKQIGRDESSLNIELFQDFTWGNRFKVSRVRYEDGIQLFEQGNTENNTVWINQDNMYIVNQEQIDKIYDRLKDLEICSFEGTSIIDPALDIGDILIINGKKVIYQGDLEYLGKFKADIKSKIQSKQKEETTTRVPAQKTINRRVQSQIDQEKAIITQLAQETTEHEEKLTKVEQDVEGIKQNVGDIINYKREDNNVTEVQTEEATAICPLMYDLKGNKEYNNFLFPSKQLNLSVNLYPNMQVL